VSGFSLHAATHVDADDRDGLERLCKYGLRPPFAQTRLSILADGRVRYELRRPWPTPSGATELVFEPLQLMRRLASLITAPYILDRILTHLSLPTHPPPVAPARQDPQSELGFDEHPPEEAYLDEPPDEHGQLASSRASP